MAIPLTHPARPEHVWVQAAPFRAHLRYLMDVTNLPWPVIAQAAGVSPTLASHLLFGRLGRPVRRLAPESAKAILRVSAGTLTQLSIEWVNAAPTTGRICALMADGYSIARLAALCRLRPAQVAALADGGMPRCTRLTELLVASADRMLPAGTPAARAA